MFWAIYKSAWPTASIGELWNSITDRNGTVRISYKMLFIRFWIISHYCKQMITVHGVQYVRPLKFWGEILLVHVKSFLSYIIYIYTHDVIHSFITVQSWRHYQSLISESGRKTKSTHSRETTALTLEQKCDVSKNMHKQMNEDLKRAKDFSERELDNYKVISQREREERTS